MGRDKTIRIQILSMADYLSFFNNIKGVLINIKLKGGCLFVDCYG